MKFSTKAIHVGQKPDATTGAMIPPIYMTSNYLEESPGQHKGYDYTRAGNPNYTNLEQTLAALENAKFATVFSAGLGAFSALATLLKSGDTVLMGNDIYGGTFRLYDKIFGNYGIKLIMINTLDLSLVEEKMKLKPKMIIFETPSNPLLRVSDIAAIVGLAKKYNIITAVDNTFATPYLQQPLALGADVVLHSATKYMGGHSDVVGGSAITNNEAYKNQFDFARKCIGLNPSPFDCWITSRGLKTLAVRMKQHVSNAEALANYLSKHKLVKQVNYPGLTNHPQHELAKKQMSGFGGMLSVEFDLSLEQTMKLISGFHIFSLAESLGGVESLVNHPATMTHASIPREDRIKSGLNDGLVRFSVGIEDEEDILNDVEERLKKFC